MTLAQIGIDLGPLPTDVTMVGVLVGSGIPIAIAAINRRAWSSEAKAICAFVVCCLAALAVCWFSGYFGGRDILSMILVVFFVSQFLYATFWRPSGIAPAVESATG